VLRNEDVPTRRITTMGHYEESSIMDTEKEVADRKAAEAKNAEAKNAEVQAAQSRTTAADREAEAQRDNVTVTTTNVEEARKAQIARTDQLLEERSKANEEGHKKNLEATEKHAERTQEHKDVPTSGKEFNRNTPVVDKDGNKHWVD
jgi:hypothetical protein